MVKCICCFCIRLMGEEIEVGFVRINSVLIDFKFVFVIVNGVVREVKDWFGVLLRWVLEW